MRNLSRAIKPRLLHSVRNQTVSQLNFLPRKWNNQVLKLSEVSPNKTIAEFRRKNKASLKNILKACARLCIKLNLIAGNTLFVDGSKVRANASIKNTWTKKKCEKALGKIDSRIEAILSECDAVDEYEQNQDSLVKMRKELKDKRALKAKV